MYKNQLQELAQRRCCSNLPYYGCIREGPDHAPRFKASVHFNGEIFESPTFCSTLRQAEHAAAQVALSVLSTRPPPSLPPSPSSTSLTSRVLDETGVYKNLLQETAHKAGVKLPVYTTTRSGPGHAPVFTSSVEIAGMNFTGDSAKTKKQSEKNAAVAAWSTLKTMPNLGSLSHSSKEITSNHFVRRDQSQARGRMVLRIHGDNNCPTQKHNSFLSLLPPPPPLPLTRTSPKFPQAQVTKIPEVPPPFDQHQRDEDEWLYTKKLSSLLDHITQNEQTHIRSRLVGPPPTPSPLAFSPIKPIKTPMCGQMGRSAHTGGYNHPQRMIAPTVQLRSVIPVCAAPLQSVRPSPSNPPSVKEVDSSPSPNTSVFNSKYTAAEEAASSSTNLLKFSSMFD